MICDACNALGTSHVIWLCSCCESLHLGHSGSCKGEGRIAWGEVCSKCFKEMTSKPEEGF